jgi:hypothetical protein
MLDPNFWLDEELAALPPLGRLLYAGLWGLCDDNYATFPDRPEWIKAQIFPYEKVDVAEMLNKLEQINKIIKFEEGGKSYWFIKNFFKYQRVEKPSSPKYPNYPVPVGEESTTTPAQEKRREVKRRENKSDVFFEIFWKDYPNKTAKKKASESWARIFSKVLEPEKMTEIIIAGLSKAKKLSQWQKDGGKFIPHPATWLNQERWADEGIGEVSTKSKTHKI